MVFDEVILKWVCLENPIPEFQEFFEIQQNKYKFVYILVFVSWVIKERPRGILFSPSPI